MDRIDRVYRMGFVCWRDILGMTSILVGTIRTIPAGSTIRRFWAASGECGWRGLTAEGRWRDGMEGVAA